MDCIPACRDTPVPAGILQRQVLPRPKPKPWLSKKDVPPWPDVPKLQKDVPPWPNVPRPQSKLRLSLKRTSKVHDSPDTISHQDSPVPSTASGDVYCGSKCTPTLSDSNLGVSNEVETCIPSPVASPDLNDVATCCSEVKDALSQVKSTLSHPHDVLYEHSIQHDIKIHSPDKISPNSHHLSVHSASPKSPFDKVAPVQHGSSTHNLGPTLYTGKKEKHLNCLGDKALGDENTRQPMVSPLIPQGSVDQSPSYARSFVSSGCAYRPLLSSKGLRPPVSHDENAHHVGPHNPFLVAPIPSKDKLSPSTKKLYSCDPVPPDLTASHLC